MLDCALEEAQTFRGLVVVEVGFGKERIEVLILIARLLGGLKRAFETTSRGTLLPALGKSPNGSARRGIAPCNSA